MVACCNNHKGDYGYGYDYGYGSGSYRRRDAYGAYSGRHPSLPAPDASIGTCFWTISPTSSSGGYTSGYASRHVQRMPAVVEATWCVRALVCVSGVRAWLLACVRAHVLRFPVLASADASQVQ